MENKEVNLAPQPQSILFNRMAYVGMLLTGLVFIFLKDWSTAGIMIGLALVCDPFNPEIPFGKRPLWQKTWLIIHLILAFSAFGLEITR